MVLANGLDVGWRLVRVSWETGAELEGVQVSKVNTRVGIVDTVNVDDGVIVRVVVVHKIRLDGEILRVCVWRARRIHGICVQSKQLRRLEGAGALKTLEDRND
jgi:hypothetical protein